MENQDTNSQLECLSNQRQIDIEFNPISSDCKVSMPLYQLKEIYETLRITSNIHKSSRKETCHDRMVMKSLGFVEDLLKNGSHCIKLRKRKPRIR